MEIRTRFAPSPTGFLHLGGARTALFNWLFARHHGGKFVLRVEDTDEARNTEEAREAILDGLRWLGLDWDEGPEVGGNFGPYFQSERRAIYDHWFEKLEATGRIYDEDGAKRFDLGGGVVNVRDRVCGDIAFDLGNEPDPTLKRPDGSYIFHFVNVVDDLLMEITHVIRGEDHLANTPKHMRICEALGGNPPEYAHIPLILNTDGSKMSKRDAGSSIRFYKENGFLPEAVVNYMALLGWSPKCETELFSLPDLVERFTLEAITHSNAKFDLQKCTWLNSQYLGQLDAEEFARRAVPFAGDLPAAALSLAHKKVSTFGEVLDYLGPCFDDHFSGDPDALEKLATAPDSAAILSALQDCLERCENWSEAEIKKSVEAAAERAGLKMGKLMQPLRLAATGCASGPDLVPLLALLGKERVLARMLHRM